MRWQELGELREQLHRTEVERDDAQAELAAARRRQGARDRAQLQSSRRRCQHSAASAVKEKSLFSDVEDRRLALLRQHTDLKARHSTVLRQQEMLRSHLQRCKAQVASLLEMSGGRSDAAEIIRLSKLLSQTRDEVRRLSATQQAGLTRRH